MFSLGFGKRKERTCVGDEDNRANYTAKRQKGVTPERAPLLCPVKSEDRATATDDPSSCTIIGAKSVVGVTSATLKWWAIPTTFYNVTTAQNNNYITVVWTSGGVQSASWALPAGNYTSAEFISMLNAQFTTFVTGVSAGVTCTASYEGTYPDMKVVFTWSGGSAYSMAFSNNSSTLYRTLGFASGTISPDIALGAVFTATNVLQLNRPRVLYVSQQRNHWPKLEVFDPSGSLNNIPIHFIIPLTQGNGAIQFNDTSTFEEQTIYFNEPTTIKDFEFKFYNENGLVQSFNGGDWSMCFEFSFG